MPTKPPRIGRCRNDRIRETRNNFAHIFASILLGLLSGCSQPKDDYEKRVSKVCSIPNLVAFWDFSLREESVSGNGRFLSLANTDSGEQFALRPQNMSRQYWQEGPAATLADFPVLDSGPFGQAIRIEQTNDSTYLPYLEVPRKELHNSSLDVKGPGKSVSLVAWLVLEEGKHAIAGIWHEGTDTEEDKEQAKVIVKGQRQFALFAGLNPNPSGVAAHVSDNGISTFGGKYAYHLAVTPEKMERPNSKDEIDASWSVAGMVFDNEANTVTAYLNGQASDHWIESPQKRWFFRNAADAWLSSKLATDPTFPPPKVVPPNTISPDQYYLPPETVPIETVIEREGPNYKTVLDTYAFTKVRTTYEKNDRGAFNVPISKELVALKVNPYYFGHDIHNPSEEENGGPFTIGRVAHSNRTSSITGYIGGVAVFDRALSPEEMKALSEIAPTPIKGLSTSKGKQAE